jgi:peptidoglycan/LPS O-acetylase OafA/YrhL
MFDILSVFMIIISLLIASIALRLTHLSKLNEFQNIWKPLFLIPFFMTGIVFLEVFEVTVLRLRSLMFLLSLIVVLISLNRFYYKSQDLESC